MSVELVIILLSATLFLVLLVRAQPGLRATTSGKLLIFAALFVLPVISMRVGFQTHFEGSKHTEFCLSCHVMEPYGQSLLLAEKGFLPAGHFQNRRIDRETACFTCHTQYTLFGDLNAKMNGIKHLWVYYSGTTPDPIELYSPYNNRECLHCHTGARLFEELHSHDMDDLVANNLPCMACHGRSHDVHEIDGQPMWLDSIEAALRGGPIE